jgi:hypothetical protein
MWVKLQSCLFDFNEDVYIGHAYIPPCNSNIFANDDFDFFETIEFCISKYNDLGKVVFSGDLNSRTSDFPDFITLDKYLDRDFVSLNNYDIPVRMSSDHIIDSHGRRLLEVCYSSGLIIGNGRLHKDKNIGNFTCCSNKGLSVVDYIMLNYEDFYIITDFDILPFTEFSDHAPLYFSLELKNRNHNAERNDTSNNHSNKIIWDKTKIPQFRASLMNDLQTIERLCYDVDHASIDHVVTVFTNLIQTKSCEIFKKTITTNRRSGSRRIDNRWFNSECFDDKKKFKSARNIFNRTKTDENRINFIRARTKYNNTKKKARKKYRMREGQNLDRLAKTEPKAFWKTIKNSYVKKNQSPENLSIENLYDHFKEIFGTELNTETNTEDIYENFFQENNNNLLLDHEITENEIRIATFAQKIINRQVVIILSARFFNVLLILFHHF